jgi:VanZ family protein
MNKKIVLYGVFILISMAFIWHNSLQLGIQSRNETNVILNFITPLIDSIGFHFKTYQLYQPLRKSAHILEFAVLGGILTQFGKQIQAIRPHKLLFVLCVGIGIAAFDEFLQTYVPGRRAQFSDVVIDSVGILAGYRVAKKIIK